jgi:predicted nucleic acid-binding protein
MTRRLFVDTSAWFALANRADPDHESARETLDSFPGRLVTSSYVFDETVTLCLYRLGHGVAMRLGEKLRSGDLADVVRVTIADETEAWTLFRQRADKDYSFTDCISFVLMRRMGISRAAAFDDDFRREGFSVSP